MWLSATTSQPARLKMYRPCSKMLLCCGSGAAVSLTNGLCRLVNTSLHTIMVRNTITYKIAGAIQIPPSKNGLPPVSRQPRQRNPSVPVGVVSAAASVPLAASNGVYHQDFILVARDFIDAFTGCHVKWLRAGLGFIFGNHLVHFFHFGSCRIVFEKCRIAMG